MNYLFRYIFKLMLATNKETIQHTAQRLHTHMLLSRAPGRPISMQL